MVWYTKIATTNTLYIPAILELWSGTYQRTNCSTLMKNVPPLPSAPLKSADGNIALVILAFRELRSIALDSQLLLIGLSPLTSMKLCSLTVAICLA